ncbi:TPA: hypothetical protein DGT35_00075 [Patescibacteria group bacterium]|nr:hypothetical protein [Patescibacteria group bacterium]|tara:strand:- start:2026 stop:2688 length:663 start_codon:yes stop_codon:yes gene_type:complete
MNRIILIIFICLLSLPALAHGQEFLFNWEGDSFVPGFYQGRRMPTDNSSLKMSFELIENDRLLNIKGKKVEWYVDGKLSQKGVGLQRITANQFNVSRSDIFVRVLIKNFKGGNLEKSFIIPKTIPKVIIERNFINNTISAGISIIKAWPLFFNIDDLSDLNFNWFSNNIKHSGEDVERPNVLELDIPTDNGQFSVNLNINVVNNKNISESAIKKINLTIK